MWFSKKKKSPDPVSKERLVAIYRKAMKLGVSMETLEKMIAKYSQRSEVAEKLEEQDTQEYENKLQRRLPLLVRVFTRLLPFAFLTVGILLLSSAIVPIVSYSLTTTIELSKENFLAPVPYEEIIEAQPIVYAQTLSSEESLLEDEGVGPLIINSELDFTNLNNWFDTSIEEQEVSDDTYKIDIPKIEVENAAVKIGGNDLKASLIHYPGTAIPGQPGAPVVFGHSILRQFYNPKINNPNRYNSIFSYIMTLNKGDEIYVTHDDVKYTYRVINKREVKPEDTYILMQRYDSRLLKLVTCTPEGTYLRRGVVTAQLVD
ncbi:MAG: sortase [Patescibacteria group bacterium]